MDTITVISFYKVNSLSILISWTTVKEFQKQASTCLNVGIQPEVEVWSKSQSCPVGSVARAPDSRTGLAQTWNSAPLALNVLHI